MFCLSLDGNQPDICSPNSGFVKATFNCLYLFDKIEFYELVLNILIF